MEDFKVTKEEKELIEVIRNYKLSFPNGKEIF